VSLSKLFKDILSLIVTFIFCGQTIVQSFAQSFGDRVESGSTSAQEQRVKKETVLPKCDRPMGSVAIVSPEKNWWSEARLQSPDALIKMFVGRSRCFTLVDRGRGFAIAERERALAAGGNLQQGSNIGGGQMKAADFVITPDIVMNNENSGGNVFGAILGAFIPGVAGVIASNISLNDKSAEVTLAVTDVRTSEQLLVTEGKATKTDISFGVGGGGFIGGGFGAAGAGSYENTALGQVVALAYLDAYARLVEEIRARQPASYRVVETPPAPVTTAASLQTVEQAVAGAPAPTAKGRPVATSKVGILYVGPSEETNIIRQVRAGTILYPTSNRSDTWWEVEDESGGKGWISSTVLQLGQ
jgi:curli biogenesis system outer membrane secretion channel CsgG